MTECRECGGHVSTEALACPHCGTPDPAPQVHARKARSSQAAQLKAKYEGLPEPKLEEGLTRRLVKAGDVLGIEVLDHVVIGGDEHASLRDLGLM